MKNPQKNSFYATIKVEGETLLALFPESYEVNVDEEWLDAAQESLLEWLDEVAPSLEAIPSQMKIMRAGQCLMSAPILDRPAKSLLH